MIVRMSGLLVLAALAATAPGEAPAPKVAGLNATLRQEAARVLDHARRHKYRNIGVLKFQVQKGAACPTDRPGPLNRNLARRLELALILAEDLDHPVGIIRDASDVAAVRWKAGEASYLTEKGRQTLFGARYPLAWGGETVEADAFYTGVVQVTADFKLLNGEIYCFDREGGPPETVTRFKAATASDDLVDVGASFRLRSFQGRRPPRPAEDPPPRTDVPARREGDRNDSDDGVTEAKDVEGGKEPFPLDPKAGTPPVELEIYYGDRRIDIDVRDGKATIPEPPDGEKVWFLLRRKYDGPERIGAVLKVNGENTLYRQRDPDRSCTMWIWDKGDPDTKVEGFQEDDKTASEFTVKARGEVEGIDYGPYLGTISLTVFQGEPETEAGPRPGSSVEDRVVFRGQYPKKPSPNLDSLRQRLRGEGPARTKGFIVPSSSKVASDVVEVPIYRPKMIFTVTIRYAKAARKVSPPPEPGK
jgi:hypothetical protein